MHSNFKIIIHLIGKNNVTSQMPAKYIMKTYHPR